VNNTTNELRGGIHPSVYFQTASNELKDIKIFICPFDKTRSAAKSFVDLTDSNISYFLNADASRNSTSSFLSGDRFLQSDGRPLGTGIFPISANTMVTWTPDQHNGGGNLLWSDGSVQQTANPIWRGAIQNQSFPTNRFLIP
jgi:prepilin-type processing-associated H-X9-DG protein